MSQYRKGLHNKLETAKSVLARVQGDIKQLKVFIRQHKAVGNDVFYLELELQSLRSLRENHEWDFRRITQEIASAREKGTVDSEPRAAPRAWQL